MNSLMRLIEHYWLPVVLVAGIGYAIYKVYERRRTLLLKK